MRKRLERGIRAFAVIAGVVMGATTTARAQKPSAIGAGAPTSVTMRNVDFHIGTGVVLHIARLRGTMHSLKQGVIDFDDLSSYLTDVDAAEVGMTGADLTNLMNDYVFNYRGAPLSHLVVDITSDGLRQRGTLHKGVDLPFDMTATVSLTDDGRIQLHATKVKILGVNGLALMDALHLNLEKMMDLSKAKGVTVKGNDLYLDALALFPPPVIRGKLSSVRIVSDKLVQTIGAVADSALPPLDIDRMAPNYMLYRGGTLHFGKLFMTEAEMLVVDADPRTPFDFDNPNYRAQLVAGHSKTLADMGLEVWMPDAAILGRKAVASK